MSRFILFFVVINTFVFGQNIIIGIAGGSGAGKTTLAGKIQKSLQNDAIIISQDNYYKDHSSVSLDERKKINYDHPDSIDFESLRNDLIRLKNNESINEPIYDFYTHSRINKALLVQPKKVIIVEGILLFAVKEIRDILDIKIFVDTDSDIRLFRRIFRDMNERGRDLDGIQKQYLSTVQPMYLEFVEPSKKYADLIIPCIHDNVTSQRVVIDYLKSNIQNKDE